MSTSATMNGLSYTIPTSGESYGDELSSYLVAISTTCLQKTGGAFTLTADVDFGDASGVGTGFGLKSLYYKSRGIVASAGVLRLANTQSVSWRNAANSADLALTASAADALTFGGTKVLLSGAVVNADINASAAIAYSKLALTGSIATADLASGLLVPVSNGGTGQTTTAAAFTSLAGATTKGDIIGFDGATRARIAVGSDGTALTADSASTYGIKWSAALTTTLAQYSTFIGNSGNTVTATNTSLLGRVAAKTQTATVTMTIATPCVVTWTSHGLTSGDTAYFTNSGGALPTGVSASTTYYATVVDANTFKLSTTIANYIAGTFVASSGSQSGTHTGTAGGFAPVAGTIMGGDLATTLSGAKTWNDVQTFKYSSGSGTAGTYDTNGTWTLTTASGYNLQLSKTGGAALALWNDTTGAANVIHLDNNSGSLRVTDNAATGILATCSQTGAWQLGVRNTASYTGVKIAGRTDAVAATAGDVGEEPFQSRVRSAGVTLSSGVCANITATKITLTPGDWDISGSVSLETAAASTVTAGTIQFGISKTSATQSGNDTISVPTSGEVQYRFGAALAASAVTSFIIQPYRYSVSANTDIYLVVTATTTGTVTAYGSYRARRAC